MGLSIVLTVQFLLLLISSVSSACPSASTKWSAWSKAPTSNGASVVVDVGDSILLDISPKFSLATLTVKGTFVFDATATTNLTLTAELIFIDGGHFSVGAPDCPFTGNVEIILTGTSAPDANLPGTKAIAATNGGKINLHGAEYSPWTNLTVTANKGDSSIQVKGPVQGWAVGDEIVIAPTAFLDGEYELRNISAIDGTTISFSTPLQYNHYSGDFHGAKGEYGETRGEVALLQRRVIVRGDDTSQSNGFGAHTICYGSATCQFSNVLFRNVGQSMARARYPVHFHQQPNSHGGWARNNVVRDSFNRAFVVHGTNYTTIQDNTAFNVQGHTYFIEDGDEFYNTFVGNLAILTVGAAGDLVGGDQHQASCFWITNTQNRIVGNHAVAASFGFWFAMPYHPIGLANNLFNDTWLQFTTILEFDRNTAHTMDSTGLFVDKGITPELKVDDGSFYQPSDYSYITSMLAKGDRIGNDADPVTAYFTRFTAYKCNDFGAWLRGYNMELTWPVFIDNRIGLEFAGANNRAVYGLFVGLSENYGTDKAYGYRDVNRYGGSDQDFFGYHFYHSIGPTTLAHCSFHNFYDHDFNMTNHWGLPKKQQGAAITSDISGGSVYPPRSRFYNLTWVNVDHIFWASDDGDPVSQQARGLNAATATHTNGDLSTLARDNDGSLTGTCGSWIVSRYNPTMYTNKCTLNLTSNAYFCPPDHSPIREIDVAGPSTDGMLIRLFDGASVKILGTPDYEAHMVVNADYLLYFGNVTLGTSYTPSSFMITMPLMLAGEYVLFAIPYPKSSAVDQIFTREGNFKFTPVSAKDLLNGFNYFWDSNSGLLWVRYEIPADTFVYQRDFVFNNNNGEGLWTDYMWQLRINMNCPGSCTVSGLDVSSVTGTYNPQPPKLTLCGDLQANGGIPVFAIDTSVEPYVIFDTQVENNWTVSGPAQENNMAPPAPSATQVLHTDSNGQLLFKHDPPVSVSAFTHVELYIMLDAHVGNRTRGSIYIQQENTTNPNQPQRGLGTDLNSPWFTAYPPIDAWEWRVVHVSLAGLRLPTDPAKIESFRLLNGAVHPYRPTAFWVSGVRFVKGTVSTQTYPPNTYFAGLDYQNRAQSQLPQDRLGPGSTGDECTWANMLADLCDVPNTQTSTTSTSSSDPSTTSSSSTSGESPQTTSGNSSTSVSTKKTEK